MNKDEAFTLLSTVYNKLSSICGDYEKLKPLYDDLDKILDWLEGKENT